MLFLSLHGFAEEGVPEARPQVGTVIHNQVNTIIVSESVSHLAPFVKNRRSCSCTAFAGLLPAACPSQAKRASGQ